MRDRHSQPRPGLETSATLERIQEALTALETRVSAAPARAARPQPAARSNDISAIRARQAALEGQTADRGALRSEIDRLRNDIEHERRVAAGGFDALRQDIRALGNAGDDLRALRHDIAGIKDSSSDVGALKQDIEALKSQVTLMAREDTLRELTDRWSVIEQEVAGLPGVLASQNDVQGLVTRLDALQDAVSEMPRSLAIDRFENEIRTLAGAVEQIAQHGLTAPEAAFHPDLDARLDEISRAISASSTPARNLIEKDTIDRIEARIAALANQVDAIPSINPAQQLPGLDARFDELTDRIEALRNVPQAAGSVPEEAYDALTGRMDEIAQAIERFSRPDSVGAPLAAELDDRLTVIDAQLRQVNDQVGAQSRDLAASLEQRFDDLANGLQQMEPQPVPAPSVDHLDQRLDEIASMLASTSGPAPAPAMFEQLETQIADIAAQLSSNQPAAPVDNDMLIGAVRSAVDQALASAPAGEDASVEALAGLTADLRSLEDLARDSESRNARTFEAIHDTLLQVVDHLSGLEEKITAPAVAEAPAEAPPMVAAAGGGPILAVSASDDGVAPASTMGIHPVNPAPPAEAAAEAARHALGQMAASAAAEESAAPAPSRSIFKNMAERLPIGRSRTASDSVEPAAPEMPGDEIVPVTDDQPIEPGTDQMALADIMARVREERTAPATGATAPGADHGKADFIAAARRAAQAAAADANLMASADPDAADGSGGGWKEAFAKRRRPILLGAAAILLAVLTIPVVRGFLAPSPQQVAVTPPAVVETVTEQAGEVTAGEDVAVAGDETGVRDVTAEASSPEGIAPDAPETPVAAGDTPAVAANTNDGGTEPPVETPVVQTVTVEEIPDIVQSTALREAAANGEPMALHVVGDLIANQTGNADANMIDAFEWYEQAADQGFAPAQYRLGNMYEKGLGTQRDYAMAKTWYQLAAEQGNASAMHNLAVLFASGTAGEPDYESAARWFMEAADLGVRDSQYNLGILSAQGQGVPQDLVESYKWFALAAMSGDEDATVKRDEVAAVLQPEQLQTAEDTTALWRARPVDAAVNVVELPEVWQIDTQQTAAQAPLSEQDMRQAVRNIQGILNANGYDAGPVDGIMGGKTRDAIIAFQRDNDLPQTGEVDRALVEKLIALANSNG